MAVDELRHNSLHRVQRHPPGLGCTHIANTIPNVGQRRHRSAVARATHDQSGVQRSDGGDVTSQSQAVADVDDVSGVNLGFFNDTFSYFVYSYSIFIQIFSYFLFAQHIFTFILLHLGKKDMSSYAPSM